MDPSLLSPPLSASSVGSRRNKFFMPLSSHGMPKAPPLSPGGSSVRSDRFGNLHSPRSTRSTSVTSPPMTPLSFRSGSFMSPPMSAKSFGTIIDSAPSTPSFSPQQAASQWGDSTLVLLSPAPSAAPTSSPPEPQWSMMTPPPTHTRSQSLPRAERPSGLGLQIESETSLSSHPVRPRAHSHREEARKQTLPPPTEEPAVEPEPERKAEDEEPGDTLGRLAMKMRSMLRRTTIGEKDKKSKKRRRTREELEYMEDVHWTEM